MNEDLSLVIRIHPIYLLSTSRKPKAPNLGSHLYSHLRTNYCFWQGFHWHLQKDLAFWFHRWTKLFQLILFVRKNISLDGQTRRAKSSSHWVESNPQWSPWFKPIWKFVTFRNSNNIWKLCKLEPIKQKKVVFEKHGIPRIKPPACDLEKVGTAVGIQINTLWFKDESSPYKSCVKKLQSFMEKNKLITQNLRPWH